MKIKKRTRKLFFVIFLCVLAAGGIAVLTDAVKASPVEEMDWGDAPDPTFPTLAASNGACHMIVPMYFLGVSIDGEQDGQPDPVAMGDDNDGNDDEDGVVFGTALAPCTQVPVTIIASAPGFIDAWMDFNLNGTWIDAGEQIFTSQAVIPGPNNLTFMVPCNVIPGQMIARFRFSSTGGLPFTGFAPDGEVEDYMVMVEEYPTETLDFGDAPDPAYPTLLASNGARHFIVPPLYLGAGVDNEPDGQPDANALGDDNDGNDDEDGVVFGAALVCGARVPVTITASVPPTGAAFVDAWIDFNADGDWADAGEQIFASVPVANGVNNLNFNVPAGATPGKTFARFRLSSTGGLAYTGLSLDGEVEDYQVSIDPGTEANLIDWNSNLVADFGANGLWYHDGSAWHWMTNKGHVGQMVVWNGNLVVDFGAGTGIQYFDGTWHWMTNSGGADGMINWNDGSSERLVVDFGAGQRVYTYNGTWNWFTNKDGVADMTVWNNKLVVDFGSGRGIYNNDGAWHWMTNKDNVALMLPWNDGGTERLVVDFGGGRRMYTYNGAWNWLTNKDDVNDMTVWNGKLIVDFGAGLCMYNYDTAWHWMSNKDDAARMVNWVDGGGTEKLAVDFGSGRNMYYYDGSWHWMKNANNVPEMAAWNNRLAVDFGSGAGIYQYINGSWYLLRTWSTTD